MTVPAATSATWVFVDGAWREGNVPIMGPRTHAAWLGSSVFDGARVFEGMAPDLDQHFARVNESARRLYLAPSVTVERWIELTLEGRRRFDSQAALYVRPMYWAEQNGLLAIAPDPNSVRWCLALYEAPMPDPAGFSLTASPFRRPTLETMPVDAKAGCLYPNNARAVFEARARGFDNCLMCDSLGNVAELANSNVFLVKDGAVHTPAPNGTYLAGITRARVIALLRDAGIPVFESCLRFADFLDADEIFSTGNFGKVLPANRIEDRNLTPGPIFRTARRLYWEYARQTCRQS